MSIYEALGGATTITAAVEDFYRRVLEDATLAPYFDHIDMARLEHHQQTFLAAALGGPTAYEGRSMRVAHAGLGITDDAFDRVVGHLMGTLHDASVDADTRNVIGERLLPLRAEIVSAPAARS